MTSGDFVTPDIDVVTVVYDHETEILSIDFDESKINNFTVLGYLRMAVKYQEATLMGEDEEDDE